VKIFNYTKQYLSDLLHLVYPEQCLCCESELPSGGQYLCMICKNELHVTNFEHYENASALDQLFWGRIQVNNVFSLLYYRENNQSRKILHQLKYSNRPDLAQYMGTLIGDRIRSSEKFKTIDLLIPVPLHEKKRYIRGYNQSEEIAKGIKQQTGIEFSFQFLSRRTHTESQTKKSKFDRWKNVQEVFSVSDVLPENIRHIALVDDVITTGSTLEAAVRMIREKHEVEVSILSIAYAG